MQQRARPANFGPGALLIQELDSVRPSSGLEAMVEWRANKPSVCFSLCPSQITLDLAQRRWQGALLDNDFASLSFSPLDSGLRLTVRRW